MLGLGSTTKAWSPLFDARNERMGSAPIWIRLPSLPLKFCSLDDFQAIGNKLGCFVVGDMSFGLGRNGGGSNSSLIGPA